MQLALAAPGGVFPNSLSSARRLFARPSAVLLDATGTHSPKLRTILWAWEGEAFDDAEREALGRVVAALQPRAALDRSLRELLTAREVVATRRRAEALLADGRFPGPNPDWPAIPWPPF